MTGFSEFQTWLKNATAALDDSERIAVTRRIATTLKSRHARRIAQNIAPDGSRHTPRKAKVGRFREKKGRHRKKTGLMFKKTSRLLKTVYTSHRAEIGYDGKIADIMAVHQYGQTIRPSQKARPTTYPVRQTVGFSPEDEAWIKAYLTEFLNSGLKNP